MFILLFISSPKVKAQSTIQPNITSGSVAEWFSQIEKYGFTLSYNPTQIDLRKVCRINAKTIGVKQLLTKVLSDYEINIIDGSDRKLILQILRKRSWPISGTLTDANSSERLLSGVVCFRQGERIVQRAVSNEQGYFSIELPPGSYQMECSYLGYKPQQTRIDVRSERHFNIALQPQPLEVSEIAIKSGKDQNWENEMQMSNMLSFSSTDVFSAVKILPSCIGSPVNDNMYVNGGNSDENLLLIDGVPIYHLYHYDSQLSAINGDAIKSVSFYRSFFPTEYEGRLSSVTDIKLKEGNKQRFGQTYSFDMPAASFEVEGPIVKDKFSFLVGGRRSWLDLFDNVVKEYERLDNSMYDINAKLSYSPNTRTTIDGSFYLSKDNFYSEEDERRRQAVLDWKNLFYTLNAQTSLTKRLTASATLTYYSYVNSVYAPVLGADYNKYLSGGIHGGLAKTDFSYKLDNNYQISWGAKASNEWFKLVTFGDTVHIHREPIFQLVGYVDNKFRIGNHWTLQIGLNAVRYKPEKHPGHVSFQPRISVKYKLSDNHLFYLDFSKMTQFYHHLKVDVLPLPTDFRMPSINGFRPGESYHTELGWKIFTENGLIETSIYYKRRFHVMSLRPNVYPENDDWNKYLMKGNGESYGFNFHVFQQWNRFVCQFSYTYARSKEWFGILKSRGKMPALFDIPHSCKWALTYRTSLRTGISVGGYVHSGKIMNELDSGTLIPDDQYRTQREKVNYRLDAAFNYVKTFRKGQSQLLLRVGLYNIVGNPSDEEYNNAYSLNIGQIFYPFGAITLKL